MTVIEIRGDADWNTQMTAAGGKLVVVDFSATWCGPCQFIKPVYHQLSNQFHDVVFLEVDEAQNKSLIGALGVRGFPTFHFYVSQRKVDEIVGADQNALRQKIEQWRQSAFNPFASAGVSLGGSSGSSAAAPSDAREARLKRFNALNLVPDAAAASNMVCDPTTGVCGPSDATTTSSASASVATQEDEDAAQREQDADAAAAQTAAAAATSTTNDAVQMGLPPVNDVFLQQLIDMGFADLRARKALVATDSTAIEAAIAWLSDHQDDSDIDAPIQFVDLSAQQRPPKQLTDEEKAAKVADLKRRIEVKRLEREAREKRDAIDNELKRRTMGQDMQTAKEDYERIQRRLAAEKLKKEKEDYKLERERIRQKLEQDKRERRARGGYLGGAPIDLPPLESETDAAVTAAATAAQPIVTLSPHDQVRASVEKLKKYRVGGDGLTALKTLRVYVNNLVEKPEEVKFRTINAANPAFRRRVASLVGGIAFLKAIGFAKPSSEVMDDHERENVLVLADDVRDAELLQFARTQLDAAITELA